MGAYLLKWGPTTLRIEGQVIIPIVGVEFTDDTETVSFWRSPRLAGGLHLRVRVVLEDVDDE